MLLRFFGTMPYDLSKTFLEKNFGTKIVFPLSFRFIEFSVKEISIPSYTNDIFVIVWACGEMHDALLPTKRPSVQCLLRSKHLCLQTLTVKRHLFWFFLTLCDTCFDHFWYSDVFVKKNVFRGNRSPLRTFVTTLKVPKITKISVSSKLTAI